MYRLYAMQLNRESVEAAAKERFSRATPSPEPGYVLIYTEGNAPAGAVEVTKEALELLSAADNRWLYDCNVVVLAESIQAHQTEIIDDLSTRIEVLEDALKSAKAEMNDGK